MCMDQVARRSKSLKNTGASIWSEIKSTSQQDINQFGITVHIMYIHKSNRGKHVSFTQLLAPPIAWCWTK